MAEPDAHTDTRTAPPDAATAAESPDVTPRPVPAGARRDRTAWVPPAVAGLLVLLVWEGVVRVLGVAEYVLPTPTAVASELWLRRGLLWEHSLITLGEILAGFGLAMLFSLPVAMLVVSSRLLERALYPLLVLSQTVPKIAIAPLFVVWFGFSALPKVLTAFLICFFPIMIDAIVGLRSVTPESVDLLRSMGASRTRTFLELRLPAALPYVFAGFKVAITLAVVGAVVGEFIGANEGLGYLLLQANGDLDTRLLFANITVLTVIGMLLFYAVELLERVMVPWRATRRDDLAAGTA